MTHTTNQSGGIIAFILIGITLLVLLGGGIYLSKQQGRIALEGTPPPAAEEQNRPEETANQPAPTSNPTPAPTTTNPQSQGTQNTPSTNRPAPTTSPTPSPSSSTPTRPAPRETPTTGVPNTGPSQIAATGPLDLAAPVVALALLAAGVTAYCRSAQTVRERALSR